MADIFNVGWVLASDEAGAAFPKPEPYIPPKNASGYLSCPAVRAYFNNVYVIKAPFSIQLRIGVDEQSISIKPVYPFSSISEAMLSKFLTIEPLASWRTPAIPVLQFISPYIFLADEPAMVEQMQPLVTKTTKLNWRIIPGTFNIYDWQRPLNWALEWDTTCGDLIIKQGEPIYMVRINAINKPSNVKYNLIESKVSEQLAERINRAKGVASIRRGTSSLMTEAGRERKCNNLIIPK